MDAASKNSSAYSWLTFLGILLLLIGIFASVRTVFNLVAFDKYPQLGVVPSTIFPGDMYYPRETDCNFPAPYPVEPLIETQPITIESESVDLSGKVIKGEKIVVTPTPYKEKPKETYEEKQKKSCLANVEESRQATKMNDISKSLFFLFLGGGLLASRTKLFS